MRILQTGFEIGFAGVTDFISPDGTGGGGGVISTTRARTGASSLKIDGTAFSYATSLGFISNHSKYWIRFSIWFDTHPASTNDLVRFVINSPNYGSLRVDSSGRLGLFNGSGSQVGAWSSALTTGQWHDVEYCFDGTGNPTVEVKLNGTTFANGQTAASGAVGADGISLLCIDATMVAYIDDIAVNSSDGSVNNTWVGNEKVALLLPISANGSIGWTAGGGGTTNTHEAVNNTPPIGATAPGTDSSQIRNGSNSGTAFNEYNLTTYTNAGIGASDTITALNFWFCHGEEVKTGTKTVKIELTTNPNAGGGTNTSAGADADAVGTFPTNWSWTNNGTSLVDNPTVTKSDSPRLKVTKTDTGTRFVTVCFMGMYVAYVPQTGGQTYTRTQSSSLLPDDNLVKLQPLRIRTQSSTLLLSDAAAPTRVLNRILSESGLLALLDSATAQRIVGRVASDAAALIDEYTADVSSVTEPIVRTLSSSLALQDELVRVWRQIRFLGDNITPTDEMQLARTLRRALDDALLPADAALRKVIFQRLAQSMAMTGDGLMRSVGFRRLASDATSLTDMAVQYRRYMRRADDGLSLLDSLFRQGSSSTVLSDSITVQDGALTRLQRRRVLQDTTEVIDQLIRSRIVGRTASDALTLDDKRALLRYLSRAETITVADQTLSTRVLRRELSDAVTLLDLFTKYVPGKSLDRVAESMVAVLDQLLPVRRYGRLVSDLLSADDKATLIRFLTRGDALQVTDAALTTRLLQRTLQDVLTLADPLVTLFVGGVRFKVLDDTITVSDGVVEVKRLRRVLGDAIWLTDPVVTYVYGGPVLRTATDTLTLSDAVARGVVRNRALLDLVQAITDQASKGIVRGRVLSESLNPTDLVLKVLARTVVLADALTFEDGILRIALRARALADALEVTDSYSKVYFDALADILDVRILIRALEDLVVLGAYGITTIGALPGATLGGYN